VGDPVRIRQILINLIDNAVKFTADGAVTVAVAPEADADRSSVYFTVADTGTGIARDKLDAVFDTFTQADASTTRRYGGSGLGLAICRQLVELMGGDIGVTSEIGRGSTFWFRLPLATVDAACAVNLPQVERRAEPTLESHRPFRVLVVDDSAINLIVARQFLRRLECDVDVAQDGGTAVDMVSRRAYDVVFMDCQMPVLDGYEATTRIRRLPCHDRTRVVAMTAHAMAGDRERCLAAGMDDYISKPIAAEELKRALSEAVLVADEGDGPSEKAALRPSHEAGV
jgi:CheY-like chemotaxis protein